MFRQLKINNQTISYQVIGDGQPVMFVHGFGEDGNAWKNQVGHFSGKIKMIIPDLPGSGRSDMIDDMSIEGMAEVLKNIIDAEFPPSAANHGGVTMLGHSMGGYITLAVAERYPEKLSRFGLIHSSAYADSEEKKVTRAKGIDFINENGAFPFLKTAIPNLFSTETREKRPGMVDEFLEAQSNFSPRALVSYYKAMMARPDRTDVLRKTTNPVLFIMGKYDAAVPVEQGLEQCHLPDNAYIHILRHSAHMGMLEEPHITNKALEEFLL